MKRINVLATVKWSAFVIGMLSFCNTAYIAFFRTYEDSLHQDKLLALGMFISFTWFAVWMIFDSAHTLSELYQEEYRRPYLIEAYKKKQRSGFYAFFAAFVGIIFIALI